MRQLSFAIILIISIAFTSCSNGQSSFPENIRVTKTEKLKRIKGTKFFVTTPATYQPMESMIRLQRDNNTYFHAMEIPNSTFTDYKSKVTKQSIESKGAKVDIFKHVTYNGYDAIYCSGPSKTAGETKVSLTFGDDTFVAILLGVYRTSDKAALEELNKIFSTSYYDKSFDWNPLELANFTFDESITGFKYAATMANMFIYSPNGNADIQTQQDNFSMFQLSTVEAPTFSKAKEYVDYVISRYAVQGIQTGNVKKQDIVIDGNQAYEVILDAIDADNNRFTTYQVIIHKETKAVIFMGIDKEHGKWIDRFKKTALTIKMKAA
jgi:hypothetical protein